MIQDYSDLRSQVKRWAQDNTVALNDVDYNNAVKIFTKLGVVP